MEKFLHEGRFSIASVYAPISFAPSPLKALKRGRDGEVGFPSVAAIGSLKSIDPERIILKKITFTGWVLVFKIFPTACSNFYLESQEFELISPVVIQLILYDFHCSYPRRVSKLKATVRYMFHDPIDVSYFKVCEVYHMMFCILFVNSYSKFCKDVYGCWFFQCGWWVALRNLDKERCSW